MRRLRKFCCSPVSHPAGRERRVWGVFRALPRILVLAIALSCIIAGTAGAVTKPDSKGTDFWLTFNSNFQGSPSLSLFIAGEAATAGVVEIPGLSSSQTFSVVPGVVTTVSIPATAMATTADGVQNVGIHVTAADEVTVYGLNRIAYSTDAYLGLPTDILGTDYVVLGWKNTAQSFNGTEFAVVATEDGTTVTITPASALGAHAAGVPYTVDLNRGQVYQLVVSGTFNGNADVSGTSIAANRPVALFAGNSCADIPDATTYYCDHIVEQIPPTTTWGKSFVTLPLATRLKGDTFRVVASEDATSVSIDGTQMAMLDRGGVFEQQISAASAITSDKPVLVAQYSNGSTWDNVTSDPFMMLIPPAEQFLGAYTVSTPASGFSTTNFINIVAPSTSVGTILLDGAAIPASSFAAIGSTGFSGAQVHVSVGSHALSSTLPFGAFVYGFSQYDSYGYPGGLSLAPISRVTTVAVEPKASALTTGSQACLTATVLDQNAAPLEGIRVDFTVSGANATAGFQTTDSAGTAQFCYTGVLAGTDTIVAAVGTLSDTASVAWTEPAKSCPLSQGYWKTHPAKWPVKSLALGGKVYDQKTLLAILKAAVRGDASMILAKQLIAAKLNILNGSDPAPVKMAIDAADKLLAKAGPLPSRVRPSTKLGHDMVKTAGVLENYNNGALTPGCHQVCGGDDKDDHKDERKHGHDDRDDQGHGEHRNGH